MNLPAYRTWAPTAFDQRGAFLDKDRQDWLVAPCIRTRDSGVLERANHDAAWAEISGNEAGDVSDHAERHRFGHWGPGWVEVILVKPGTDAAEVAQRIADSLDDYPVVDEELLSTYELEAADEAWDDHGFTEYLGALAERLRDEQPAIPPDLSLEAILELISELDAELLKDVIDAAREHLGWWSQLDGDGVTLNIRGLANESDLDEVVAAAVRFDWHRRRSADICKLVLYLGYGHEVVVAAVSRDLDTVTAIHALAGELASPKISR